MCCTKCARCKDTLLPNILHCLWRVTQCARSFAGHFCTSYYTVYEESWLTTVTPVAQVFHNEQDLCRTQFFTFEFCALYWDVLRCLWRVLIDKTLFFIAEQFCISSNKYCTQHKSIAEILHRNCASISKSIAHSTSIAKKVSQKHRKSIARALSCATNCSSMHVLASPLQLLGAVSDYNGSSFDDKDNKD